MPKDLPGLYWDAARVFHRDLAPEDSAAVVCDARQHPPEGRCETYSTDHFKPQEVASAAALDGAWTVDRVLYNAFAG